MNVESRHQCLIYEGPPSRQLPTLATMIQRKLDEGYRCLYLNSPTMVAGLRSCLSATGFDVSIEVAKARLTLSSQTIGTGEDGFDVESMLRHLEDSLDQALDDGYRGLWASGDMTWEFGSEKNFTKLMEYEYKLENLFLKRHELCGICQYHMDTLPCEAPRQGLLTHRAIFINETLSRLNPHYVPFGQLNNYMVTDTSLDRMIAELCLV